MPLRRLFCSFLLPFSAACAASDASEADRAGQADDASAPTAQRGADPGAECRVEWRGIELPAEVRESSGAALGRRNPGVIWTHGDSNGEPDLFAVDSAGRLVARVRVTGAENNDWEDVSAGPCPGGSCLYLADTGDNKADRQDVEIYRVPEPALGMQQSAPAERFTVRYEDGPRDAEALFVLPSGDLFVVSKGGKKPSALYRLGEPLHADRPNLLRRVREFTADEERQAGPVTGASASPDGAWVAIRTLTSLALYRARDLLDPATAATPTRTDLRSLDEPQGEAVALGTNGRVVLTSEAETRRTPAVMARLTCPLQ